MSTLARIGLSFDSNDVENCWFVVDFSRHLQIADIENDIKRKYFKSADEEMRVVLKLNNFRFPPSERSVLLRDNDIVDVSLVKENKCNNTSNNCDIFERKPKKERKRKHVNEETDETRHTDESDYSLRKIKKSKKIKHRDEKTVELSIDDGNETKKKKHKKKLVEKADPIKDITDDCKHQVENDSVPVEDNTRLVPIVTTTVEDVNTSCLSSKMEVLDNSLDVNSSVNEHNMSTNADQDIVKSKRKRSRKRKRKTNFTDTSANEIADTSSSQYTGRKVGYNETFHGSLPDKLENPKNYRHGYRNLQTYHVVPNKHKKFGSDSDSNDLNESTEQYNFLCKKQENSKPSNIVTNTSTQYDPDFKSNSTEAGREIDDIKTGNTSNNAVWNGIDTALNGDNNQSSSILEDLNEHSSHNEEPYIEKNRNNYQNTSYNYETMSDIKPVETRSPLMRKTLSNGVSVFTRHRSPRNTFIELTKEAQLRSSNTNVSVIFKNPEPTNFNSSQSQSPAPKPCLRDTSHVTEESSETNLNCTSWENKNLETYPLLQKCPKTGEIIAYKILEISTNLTPEVSSYKVAKVLNCGKDEMLELKNLLHPMTGIQNDKFHVHLENEDEILTNVNDSDLVVLHFSSLLETRILST
ncbi:hypothetical protein ACF0H5_001096 [Mactra antiquata]